MEIADLIRSTKDYIAERIELSRRKLLLVYKNTRDEVKKNELETTFKQIDRDLQKLDQGQFEEKDLARYGISAQDLEMALEEIIHNKRGGYRILHNIPIEPVSPNTRNDEVNAIWSYLARNISVFSVNRISSLTMVMPTNGINSICSTMMY